MGTAPMPEHSGVEKAVEEAVGRLGPLEHPRAGEWPAIEREHAVALVSQALRDPAIQPFLAQPDLRKLLLTDEAKGALYDADRRYQNVDPRKQSEDGWATALIEAVIGAASPQPENSGGVEEGSYSFEVEPTQGAGVWLEILRETAVAGCPSHVLTLPLSEPELEELTAKLSAQPQLSDEDRERIEDAATRIERIAEEHPVGFTRSDCQHEAAALRRLASQQQHGEVEEDAEAKRQHMQKAEDGSFRRPNFQHHVPTKGQEGRDA